MPKAYNETGLKYLNLINNKRTSINEKLKCGKVK